MSNWGQVQVLPITTELDRLYAHTRGYRLPTEAARKAGKGKAKKKAGKR